MSPPLATSENPAGLAPQGFDDVQRPLPRGGGRDVLAPPRGPSGSKYKRLVYLVLGKSCLPTGGSRSPCRFLPRGGPWDQG
nr:hypothetical protein [Caulobacter sp. FWC2]